MSESANEFPRELTERLELLLGTQPTELFGHKRRISLRANSLKVSSPHLQAHLETQGFQLQTVDWYTDAFTVTGETDGLTQLPLYQAGWFYLQNLSSMIPALALNPEPGSQVLDLTAAPGSKTTQLAALMQNQGQLLANDLSRTRTYKLKANLEQQGVLIAQTTTQPGENLWKRYPEVFTHTLLDAPCTMEGRIQYAAPHTWSDWSLKKIKQLRRRQQFLLRSAVSATQPGGSIVYSTCTLAPEENEAVIQWILEREAGAVELEDISIPHLQLEAGRTEWLGQHFSPELVRAKRVNPSAEMEGFFVAKLRKTRSTVGKRPARKKRNKYASVSET